MSDRPTSDLGPAQARNTRARAWAYILRCWQDKQGAAPTQPGNRDDVEDPNRIRGKEST